MACRYNGSAIDRQASKSSYVMPTSHDGMIPSFLFSDEISAAGCNTPHSSIRRNTAIIDIVLMMFIGKRANNAAMVFSVLIASLAGFSLI